MLLDTAVSVHTCMPEWVFLTYPPCFPLEALVAVWVERPRQGTLALGEAMPGHGRTQNLESETWARGSCDITAQHFCSLLICPLNKYFISTIPLGCGGVPGHLAENRKQP